MTYQKPDAAFIDYDLYAFGRMEQSFRGPAPDLSKPYVACLGSAHTFGRYVAHPFPSILQEELGMTVANWGAGGGGPGFFLRDSGLLEAASNAEVCVIQVMSARSLSNRLFQVKPKRNSHVKAVSEAMQDLFPHVDFDTFTFAHNMLNQLADVDEEKFREVEAEMKAAWVARMRLLLDSIYTRKILFWFSEREPDEAARQREDKAMLKYPQHVDRQMIDAVSPHVDLVVKAVSGVGMPQALLVDGEPVLSTPWGVPVSENRYYPSPEMHVVAAAALRDPIQSLLDD